MLWWILTQVLISYLILVLLSLVYTLIRILRCFHLSKIVKFDMKKKYGTWAVVTGGTRGIGRAYANELAKRGINIFIISIGMDDLVETSQDLRLKYGVETEFLEVDFTDGIKIYKEIEDKLKGLDIGILVNNVGIGLGKKPFSTIRQTEMSNVISINIIAATFMTNIILPRMIKNGRGAIVNISSISSFAPMPHMSVYSASKSYIRFFSKILEEELRGSGVIVQTVAPFYVSTAMTSAFKGMIEPSYLIPSPEDFVASAITTLGYANETCGYVPHEMIAFSLGLLPDWILMRLMSQMHQRMNIEESKTK